MADATNSDRNTRLIKEWARELGFLKCGIARADFLAEDAPLLEKWLNQGMHGSMQYMENHFEKRLDPRKLVPGARSVVSLMYNYTPEKSLPADNTYKIARYAYGTDYHFVIKDKLKSLMHRIHEEIGHVDGRVLVATATVIERYWAKRSGMGWIGKNSLLLNRQHGSYFFLAELIIDLDLTPDPPVGDYCGTCTACMDACPTDAIPFPFVVDGSRCISYLTIELKSSIPGEFKDKMEDWIFGCDICQEVCPWNRFASPHTEKAFDPHPDLAGMKKRDWEEMTEETFRQVFKKSPLKRAKYAGIKRNIEFLRTDTFK